jgi:hypothetical protein
LHFAARERGIIRGASGSLAGLEFARALSVFVVACGSSGPESFIGDAWLVDENMTVSCGDATTTEYPLAIAFLTNEDGSIAYYDKVVHCTPAFVVDRNVATLAAPPVGCSTIIDQQIAPIDITQGEITSTGSNMRMNMTGTVTVNGAPCAISIDATGAR